MVWAITGSPALAGNPRQWSDGTVWNVDSGACRTLLWMVGGQTMFVAGCDQRGEWIALMGHQLDECGAGDPAIPRGVGG